MKIKIFCSRLYGDLEKQVNEWLEEQNDSISVVDIKFIKEDEMFVIMIQYKEKIIKPFRVKAEDFDFNYEENNKKGE